MPSTVTTAGEQFLNTVATGHTPLTGGLLADQILFAHIDGLDHTQTPPVSEAVPETLVHTAQVTRASNLNADTALFSTMLESSIGDFSFNWLGLYNSEYGVLIQVSYEPVQQKIATDGPIVGNVLAKGLALQVLGGQSVLDMQTATESWQFDFSGRQKAAEEIQRNAMRGVYGSGAYVNTAGSVTKGASVYQVAAGSAVIDGLRVEIDATETAIASDTASENYPFYVYAEVWQQVDSNAVTNHCAIVTSQTALTELTDAGGNVRTRVLLATLEDSETINDDRETVEETLSLVAPATITHRGPNRLATVEEHEQRDESQASATPSGVDAMLSKMFAGMISQFPGTVAPAGWLKANGQTVNRADYPYLWEYAQAGGNLAGSEASKTDGQFGPGDGSLTFTLPDLRGVHLRNWDDGKGVDGSRSIGSNQDDENKSHSHEASSSAAGSHSHTGTAAGAGSHSHTGTTGTDGEHNHAFMVRYRTSSNGNLLSGSNVIGGDTGDYTDTATAVSTTGGHTHSMLTDTAGLHTHTVSTNSTGSHSHTVTVNSSGGAETRVKNIAVMVCIKY